MRWSVGDASWPSDAGLTDGLEDRVARRLDQYQEPTVAVWTWVLLTATFITMVLFAVIH
jgi:hypothetical protein